MGDTILCCKPCSISVASYQGHFDILNTYTSTLHADDIISISYFFILQHDWKDYLFIPNMQDLFSIRLISFIKNNLRLGSIENNLHDVGCTNCSKHLGWYLSRKYVIPPKSLKMFYLEENKRFYADIETENRFST
ncbi:hypothetical protein ACJIZ3_004829 [Penstemon smallii]|uniref:Protein yippee-like n=1 Tax=Penstemon smallii TaxID=265156 RepID=A0ABD3S352_9LAMI